MFIGSKNNMFIPTAKRALYGPCSDVLIPADELKHWRTKFGNFDIHKTTGNGVRVQIADLRACDWGRLQGHKLVNSSTPLATGPQDPKEHRSECTKWGLFADSVLVYKSIRKHDRVRTVLSWYGHGGYDPESPGISRRERARVHYDPEYPDIELM